MQLVYKFITEKEAKQILKKIKNKKGNRWYFLRSSLTDVNWKAIRKYQLIVTPGVAKEIGL